MDEVGAHVVINSPADDAAAVGVDDGRQIHPALPRPQIRNVANPDLIQCPEVPLPFHRIHWVGISVVDYGCRLSFLRADPRQTQAFHGPGNRLAGDDLPVHAQVGEDPRGPVDLVRIAVEEGDLQSGRRRALNRPPAVARHTSVSLPSCVCRAMIVVELAVE